MTDGPADRAGRQVARRYMEEQLLYLERLDRIEPELRALHADLVKDPERVVSSSAIAATIKEILDRTP